MATMFRCIVEVGCLSSCSTFRYANQYDVGLTKQKGIHTLQSRSTGISIWLGY